MGSLLDLKELYWLVFKVFGVGFLLFLVQFGNPVYPDLQFVHFFPEIFSLQMHSNFESQNVEVEPLILQTQAEIAFINWCILKSYHYYEGNFLVIYLSIYDQLSLRIDGWSQSLSQSSINN